MLSDEVVEVNTRKVRPAPRLVPHPTQNMTFERTGGLHDVHNFVLSDPRMLLYDLASHRQLVRAYLEDEPPPEPKKKKRTAVRVYVCDASGSMHGARARFRDALIIAELNNLRVKARQGQPFDPLYFSFFNDIPTELSRVDTAREATRQIEKLFRHSPAEGQTDITLALMSAFDSIRAARGRDPYLARATVVIITDGEDRVDLELIRRTRAPMDSLDIALSFVSLGEENPDLKSLVQEQSARGGRAFYHHLSDREIQWARTEFDSPWRTLLPRDVPVTPEALEALGPQLAALEALAAGRSAPAAPLVSEASFDALFPAPETLARQQAPEVPEPEVVARVADILDALVEAPRSPPPIAAPPRHSRSCATCWACTSSLPRATSRRSPPEVQRCTSASPACACSAVPWARLGPGHVLRLVAQEDFQEARSRGGSPRGLRSAHRGPGAAGRGGAQVGRHAAGPQGRAVPLPGALHPAVGGTRPAQGRRGHPGGREDLPDARA
ncbi:hypothetical protein ACN28S_14195 [Cystobacter fuscus]